MDRGPWAVSLGRRCFHLAATGCAGHVICCSLLNENQYRFAFILFLLKKSFEYFLDFMNLPFFRFHKCISLVYVIQHLFPLQIECSELEEIADAINDYFVISYSTQLVL